MDYEQKYKEALERAKAMIKVAANQDEAIGFANTIFPELKESKDEKIRKELLDFCKNRAENYPNDPKYKNISAWITWLEKQGEQKEPQVYKTEDGEIITYSETDGYKFAEPKFKVKYAGSEYNVLDVKDIAGVTYYVIEDEPNHIDYVQAENCERVDGYSIKESGSPFPTKPAKFSEQKPAWSEEDELMILGVEQLCNCASLLNIIPDKINKVKQWLKSLKERLS